MVVRQSPRATFAIQRTPCLLRGHVPLRTRPAQPTRSASGVTVHHPPPVRTSSRDESFLRLGRLYSTFQNQ